MQIPKRKSESHRRYDDSDSYLTPERISELEDELGRLNRTRPKVVEELTVTREMGDLSENAAYQHAKGRLAGIDRRVFEIREKLKHAVVIERGTGVGGTVRIGSAVTVTVNGKERTLEITGSEEADPGTGKISYRSPVGAALMSKKTGDTVTLTINDKEVVYGIVAVE